MSHYEGQGRLVATLVQSFEEKSHPIEILWLLIMTADDPNVSLKVRHKRQLNAVKSINAASTNFAAGVRIPSSQSLTSNCFTWMTSTRPLIIRGIPCSCPTIFDHLRLLSMILFKSNRIIVPFMCILTARSLSFGHDILHRTFSRFLIMLIPKVYVFRTCTVLARCN